MNKDQYPDERSETEEHDDLIDLSSAADNEDAVLKTVSPFRIALPILIGLSVVIYLFLKEFNFEEFSKIKWTAGVLFWICGAGVFMCLRHFFYMARLRIITDGFFNWKKAFELILMWEFSSAVTPTNVGGAAVAMFAIAQEKLSAGKTAMIVLYTVIVDTFFFLSALLFFFSVFGAIMIQPEVSSLSDVLFNSQWGIPFFIAYGIMMTYGSLIFYGVLINTKGLQRLLLWFCKFRWLKRFEPRALKMTEEMGLASAELRTKSWSFHLGTFFCTASAWISRFMVLNCLIIAFVVLSPDPEIQAHYNKLMTGDLGLGAFMQQTFIYARQQAMYVIMAVLPTPGGAGAAEYAFKTFHYDYLPQTGTLLVIIAILWRMFTYYVYLFVGAVAVPNWIRKIIERNRWEQLQQAKKNSVGRKDLETYDDLMDD